MDPEAVKSLVACLLCSQLSLSVTFEIFKVTLCFQKDFKY